MSKLALFILLITFGIHQVSAGLCTEDKDCNAGECCARSLGGLISDCKPYTTAGQICGRSALGLCACAEGLYCKPYDPSLLNPFKIGNGVCTAKPAETA